MNIIYGIVNADGSKRSGTGYTSKRTQTGEYEIDFTNDFAGEPAVTATVLFGEPTDVAQTRPTNATCTVFTFLCRTDATARDSVFSFIAIGPN